MIVGIQRKYWQHGYRKVTLFKDIQYTVGVEGNELLPPPINTQQK